MEHIWFPMFRYFVTFIYYTDDKTSILYLNDGIDYDLIMQLHLKNNAKLYILEYHK